MLKWMCVTTKSDNALSDLVKMAQASNDAPNPSSLENQTGQYSCYADQTNECSLLGYTIHIVIMLFKYLLDHILGS